jgi:uncharacterized protein (DUF1330 family)
MAARAKPRTNRGERITIYVIAMFSISDRAAYQRYQAQFMSVMNRHKGRLLAADEHPVVLEGNWDRDKVVVLSFPNEAGFREFADSPEYQEISKDRRAGPDGFVVLVRGVPECE